MSLRRIGLLLWGVCLVGLPARAMGPFHANPPEVVAGMTALAAGEAQQALDAFDAAKARLGSRPELEHNRALALSALGRRDEAARIFKQLADDPSLPKALRAKSAYHLGNVHAAGSARQEALSAYRQALTLEPGDEDARHNFEVLLRNVPPPQESPSDGGTDAPDGGEPEKKPDDGEQDGQPDGGEDAGEDGGDAGDGEQEGQEDGGQDGGGEDGESPEDGGEEPGSGEEEGPDAGEGDGGEDGDAGQEGADAGEGDGGSDPDGGEATDAGSDADAGADAGEDGGEGDGDADDLDGGEGDAGSGEADPDEADAGESGGGSAAEGPEPSEEGQEAGLSESEAETMLDALKQDERNLQLWRFGGKRRPRDGNQKDW